MYDYKALRGKAYFVLKNKGIRKVQRIEAKPNGIMLYVLHNGSEEKIDANEIEHILLKIRPKHLGVLNDFMRFLQTDLADRPLLLRFVLALWNEDYARATSLFSEDECAAKNFLRYIQRLVRLQEYNEILSDIFANYLEFKEGSSLL